MNEYEKIIFEALNEYEKVKPIKKEDFPHLATKIYQNLKLRSPYI